MEVGWALILYILYKKKKRGKKLADQSKLIYSKQFFFFTPTKINNIKRLKCYTFQPRDDRIHHLVHISSYKPGYLSKSLTHSSLRPTSITCFIYGERVPPFAIISAETFGRTFYRLN